MSNYRKEKNLIIINLDNVSGEYHLDINTGILYGVKGSPIKTCPKKHEVFQLFTQRNTNLEVVICRMLSDCSRTLHHSAYVPAMMSADKIDALNVGNLNLYQDQYEFVGNYLKELKAYLNTNPIETFSFRNFKQWALFEKAKSSLGSVANLLTAEMYSTICDYLPDITTEELGVCAYYLGRGKYWEYHNGNIHSLTHYIRMCREMEIEPQKNNNFMREYCETLKTYELRKTEFDNKRIANNYAKHSKAWDFEYGDFTILIPTCGQDIVTEGNLMHHCVGSYVNRVIENSTYICFVRHKDTPNTPYITCQVYPNGEIGQYFLAYDRYISSEEDLAFKEAFRRHLAEVWG